MLILPRKGSQEEVEKGHSLIHPRCGQMIALNAVWMVQFGWGFGGAGSGGVLSAYYVLGTQHPIDNF